VDKLDADRGGSVDAKEFANGLLALGIEATKEELYSIFDDLDTDGSKSLSMDEIVNFVSRGHEVQVKAKDYAKQLTKDMKEAEKEGKEGQRRVREMLLTDQREKEEEAQKAIVEAAAKAKAEEAAAAEAKAKAEAAAKAAQQKKEEFERRIEERRIAQSQGKP
jgi:Ca2+-binding EF-hand superfamily protein